jgi:limonene-1,2-epoxide hydrolase
VATPVELFEAAVDALNRTDRSELERLIDPEIVFVPLRAAVTGPFIGHKGLEDFLAENAERFDLFQAEFDEVRALPDGRVLAIGHIRMRNKGGKIDSRYLTAGIAVFRDDRMCSWRDYGNVAEALKNAGLAPE